MQVQSDAGVGLGASVGRVVLITLRVVSALFIAGHDTTLIISPNIQRPLLLAELGPNECCWCDSCVRVCSPYINTQAHILCLVCAVSVCVVYILMRQMFFRLPRSSITHQQSTSAVLFFILMGGWVNLLIGISSSWL